MLNQERVILMTKMASYEENEGKKNVAIGGYFRSDFISLQMIRSVINGTLAYFIVVGMYVFYNFEVFMQEIYNMDIMAFGKGMIIRYLILVGSYSVLSYIVYSYRYSKAKKSLKCYFNNLKKLSKSYEREGK